MTPALAERARKSHWVTAVPGLADSVQEWDEQLALEQAALASQAAHIVRPGPIPPRRAIRHGVALSAAQLRWLTKLPSDFAALRPLRHPGQWLEETVAHVVRDHLAALGPAGAELARMLEASDVLVPDSLTAELRRRPVRTPPLPETTVRHVATRRLGEEIARLDPALSATALTQLHPAQLEDGRHVLVRVVRPGVRRALAADARMAATTFAPWERALPAFRDAPLRRILELAARQLLEATDLRHQARNAIEVGLMIEDLQVDGIVALQPLPGLVTADVAAFAAPATVTPLMHGLGHLDHPATISALVRLTLESALALSAYPGDLDPNALAVLVDGRLVVTRYSTVGRLDDSLQTAAVEFLVGAMTGDHERQVAAMRGIGAVPDDADTTRLVDELSRIEFPDPLTLITGTDVDLAPILRAGIALMIRHRLRLPFELLSLLRAVLNLRTTLAIVNPGKGLLTSLVVLLPRLSCLLADASTSRPQ